MYGSVPYTSYTGNQYSTIILKFNGQPLVNIMTVVVLRTQTVIIETRSLNASFAIRANTVLVEGDPVPGT